jgi:hypothetical protein
VIRLHSVPIGFKITLSLAIKRNLLHIGCKYGKKENGANAMKSVWKALRSVIPIFVRVRLLKLIFILSKVYVFTFVWLIRFFSGKLTLTYLASYKQDGTGAQIQRQFSIFALSRVIRTKYFFTKYAEISVHPLDPFQTPESYERFLYKLNKELEISGSEALDEAEVIIDLPNPSVLTIFLIALKSFFTRKDTCLQIGEPYRVTEFFPEYIPEVTKYLPNWKIPSLPSNSLTIVIHYRQGVGGMVTYPGQKIPREISLDYFKELLSSIKSPPNIARRIVVLTDAPTEITFYKPPSNQTYLWEGTPGFQNGKLTIQPLSFDELKNFGDQLEVKSGGMAMADVLFMGRSSLSYVGAILNQSGLIYFPRSFWHRSLRSWISL